MESAELAKYRIAEESDSSLALHLCNPMIVDAMLSWLVWKAFLKRS